MNEIKTGFYWNGSKTWLLKDLKETISQWNGKGKYIEPFVGGGSVSCLVRNTFPEVIQYISDANPWLISAFQVQLYSCNIPENYTEVEYWRNIKDEDFKNLSICQRATRFAVCLLTAWGGRWKTAKDGSMGKESVVDKKLADPIVLRRRFEKLLSVKWLREEDEIRCLDWKEAVKDVEMGDLVYLDPPYPESLGYGNNIWKFENQLDLIDWVEEAAKKGINIVVSNMSVLERLYRRAGLNTKIVKGPKKTKTRTEREEVIAWKFYE